MTGLWRNKPRSVRPLARVLVISWALVVGIFGTFELHRRMLKVNEHLASSWLTFMGDAPWKPEPTPGPEPERCPSRPAKLAADPTCPRILIYVTTHLPEQHLWHLKTCWPTALRNSLLLNSSDVLVYLSRNEINATNAANATGSGGDDDGVRLLKRTFRHQNLTIRVRPNLGYQESAKEAFSDAARLRLWSGYDWVVRVNPDVIIRNDSELLGIMHDDANATGIFVNCRGGNTKSPIVHTDFLAIKPAALGDGNALLGPLGGKTGVETWFTREVTSPILGRGNHRWLDAAAPKTGYCRAGYTRDASPVVHSHTNNLGGDACHVPFG